MKERMDLPHTIRPLSGGVTTPAGYRASGLHCGIKASGKPDLSLLVSDTLASAAGAEILRKGGKSSHPAL